MVKYLADVRSVLKDCGITALDGRSAVDVYEEYYEKQKNNEFIFSLVDFGSEFGLKFNYADFKDSPISGYLEGKQIVINKEDAPQRQRFTIAHELGHFFYKHEPKIMDPMGIELLESEGRDSSNKFLGAIARNGDINTQELQANEFAGALLMPADLVNSNMEDIIIPKYMLFNVSEPAWNFRTYKIKNNTSQ